MGQKPVVKKLSANEKELLKKLGKRIRLIRKKNKMSLEDTVSENGIKNYPHFVEIEQGKRNISITTLFKVANTLGVRVTELLEGLDL